MLLFPGEPAIPAMVMPVLFHRSIATEAVNQEELIRSMQKDRFHLRVTLLGLIKRTRRTMIITMASRIAAVTTEIFTNRLGHLDEVRNVLFQAKDSKFTFPSDFGDDQRRFSIALTMDISSNRI